MPNYGIRIGAGATDDVTAGKLGTAGPGTTNYMTFESPIGTDFVVTGGKTLYITKIQYGSPTANHSFQIGHGSDGVPDQAGAPTDPKILVDRMYGLVAQNVYTADVFIPIPTGRYPFIKSSLERVYCTFFGFEA